jgi:hypothetical protein
VASERRAIGTVKPSSRFRKHFVGQSGDLSPIETNEAMDQGLLADGLQMIGELRSIGLDIKKIGCARSGKRLASRHSSAL